MKILKIVLTTKFILFFLISRIITRMINLTISQETFEVVESTKNALYEHFSFFPSDFFYLHIYNTYVLYPITDGMCYFSH